MPIVPAPAASPVLRELSKPVYFRPNPLQSFAASPILNGLNVFKLNRERPAMTSTDTTAPTALSDNPLLVCSGLPGLDRLAPEHVVPGVKARLEDLHAKLDEIEANATPTWDGLIKPLEAISLAFEYFWSPVGHLLGVKNSDELRAAHEAVQPEVVKFTLRLGQSRPIYDAMVAMRDGDAWASLDEAQQRIVTQRIRDAEHAGVALEGDAKARFLEIAESLSKLSTDFSNHTLDATKAFELIVADVADTAGWPTTLKNVTSQSYNTKHKPAEGSESTADKGPWRVTLDFPSFFPFMQHSRNRGHREQVYRAYVTRASAGKLDNREIIEETLKLRKEKAGLLGFDCFADLSLSDKMAGTVAAVAKISDEVTEASRAAATKDLDELRTIAKASGQSEDVAHWDVSFWAERLSEQRFDFTDEQLRPYFPMPRVIDGLFGICEKLFGTTFKRDDLFAPRWNDDVAYYHVISEAGETIAGFYLDPYARPENKQGGAWVDICLSRRYVAGELVVPVIHVTCNGTPPVGDPGAGGTPSLMSFSEVETLFHEFGHALQGMLTTIDYADASGLGGIEWDAVEIASQFMENWCYHKPTLMGMTAHVETGESLPDALFEKLLAARTFRKGSRYMRQLEFGVTDMTLHSTHDPASGKTAGAVHHEISQRYSALAPLEESQFLCGFGHIFAGGYAAGYYSYLWSEVLSADCFGAFEDAGLDNERAVAETGRRFRDTFLALGGGRHPAQVFEDFRGRGPSTEALLRHNGLA